MYHAKPRFPVADHPRILAWMQASTLDFAASLRADAARHNGQLTDPQIKAAYRCADAFASAVAGKAARPAPSVDSGRLERVFADLRASGLKKLRITMRGFTVKPAPETGRNPGALYVTDEGGAYLGKIAGGAFVTSRECSADKAQRIADLIADPRAAIEGHGKETGNCAVCNRELTDPVSVAIGIGPICRDRLGW